MSFPCCLPELTPIKDLACRKAGVAADFRHCSGESKGNKAPARLVAACVYYSYRHLTFKAHEMNRATKSAHSRSLSSAASAMAIPGLMAACPLVGFFLGEWVDQRFKCAPWGKIIGVFLGLAAGAVETTKIIRRISVDDESDSGHRPRL